MRLILRSVRSWATSGPKASVAGMLGCACIVVLAGCGSSGSSSAATDRPDRLRVVASTDVYGDIAHQIGGDQVTVTSLVDDASIDPHSYEATVRDQLAISKADIVIKNGGGYDDFINQMLHATGSDDVSVLDAVEVSGKQAKPGAELNEHVFYDPPSMVRLAKRLATVMSQRDPSHAGDFDRRTRHFDAGLARLGTAVAQIKSDHGGDSVAVTEPLASYLLTAAGLVDRTPGAFSEAVEEGTPISAKVLHETLGLLTGHHVSLVVTNAQTSSPATDRVVATAKDEHIPVVALSETLPKDADYLTWMRANLTALTKALR